MDRNRFGTRLKELRQAAGYTLGPVARHLDVSVSYLSDIERGYRNPFSIEHIRAVAQFLAADENELMGLASADRGRLELETADAGKSKLDLAGALQRRWDDLTERDIQILLLGLNKKPGNG